MIPDTTFFIDRSKSPKQNPILSLSNASSDDGRLIFIGGDKLNVGLVFVTDNNVDTSYATSSLHYYLAIGEYESASPYTTTTRWGVSGSWGVTGSLDLSTAALTGSFGTSEYIEPTVQLSVTQSNGSRQTVMLRKARIYNPVNL